MRCIGHDRGEDGASGWSRGVHARRGFKCRPSRGRDGTRCTCSRSRGDRSGPCCRCSRTRDAPDRPGDGPDGRPDTCDGGRCNRSKTRCRCSDIRYGCSGCCCSCPRERPNATRRAAAAPSSVAVAAGAAAAAAAAAAGAAGSVGIAARPVGGARWPGLRARNPYAHSTSADSIVPTQLSSKRTDCDGTGRRVLLFALLDGRRDCPCGDIGLRSSQWQPTGLSPRWWDSATSGTGGS